MTHSIAWTIGPIAVGLGGAVAGERIVAVAQPVGAGAAGDARHAAEAGDLVRITFGRRVRAVVFMDSGHGINSTISA